MKFAIFYSYNDAMAFDVAVSVSMGWPDASAKTDRYAVPMKHPLKDEWAMPIFPYAEQHLPAGATCVDGLADDWNQGQD